MRKSAIALFSVCCGPIYHIRCQSFCKIFELYYYFYFIFIFFLKLGGPAVPCSCIESLPRRRQHSSDQSPGARSTYSSTLTGQLSALTNFVPIGQAVNKYSRVYWVKSTRFLINTKHHVYGASEVISPLLTDQLLSSQCLFFQGPTSLACSYRDFCIGLATLLKH